MAATYYAPPRLDKIVFRGGHIDFEYNSSSVRDLKFIKIYNNIQTQPLQTINLQKSQFLNNRGDRLDKVVFSNSQGDNYEYGFEYYGNPQSSHWLGMDYWGYYNGQGSIYKQLIPNFTIRTSDLFFYTLPGTDRSVNESVMKGGILTKIIYPTKGYTKFEYEAHRASNQMYGGLRIKELYNFNADSSLSEKKWYKYGDKESGEGRAAAYPTASDFCTATRILSLYEPLFEAMRLGQVIDIRQFSVFPKKSYFSSGSSVVYRQVTEYAGDATSDYGKTVYSFSDNPDQNNPHNRTAREGSVDMPFRTYTWMNGMLISKKIYKKENGNYTQIYYLENDYKEINTAEYRNLRVLPYISISAPIEYYDFTRQIMECFSIMPNEYRDNFGSLFSGQSYVSPYNYFNYYITTGLYVLSSTRIYEDSVSKMVYYANYNSFGLPKETRTILSSGDTEVINYEYFYSTISEKTTYKNTRFLEKGKADYKQYHSKFYAPENFKIQHDNQFAEIRSKYDYDVSGNIKESIRDAADKTVYLWGYNSLYPIAEIRNASYSDIVPAKITEAALKTIAEKNEPSTSDWTTIENLRNLLPAASITTCKYKPLVGMTSATDPHGVTVFYEYDNFGRLKTAKDNNGNIIEKYDYHYKN